eukprot:10656-Prymnesium_polylepis.1
MNAGPMNAGPNVMLMAPPPGYVEVDEVTDCALCGHAHQAARAPRPSVHVRWSVQAASPPWGTTRHRP